MKYLLIVSFLISGCVSAGVQGINMEKREITLGTSHYEDKDDIGGYLADYNCVPKKIRMEPDDEINKFHRFFVTCEGR